MRRIVFYSWQSDLPNATNRSFIQRALEEAANAIATDDTVAVEPVVDRDTQGVPGSPDIAATIFSKISGADLFVADVSIISRPRKGRPAPNPNVLIELGYALKALSSEQVILVFNRAFGKIEDLPFDLKMRRVLAYDMKEDASERAPERVSLRRSLEVALRAGLERLPTPVVPSPKSAAELIKEIIASPASEMRLDAYVSEQVRRFQEATSLSEFPVAGVEAKRDQFLVRLPRYDEVCRELEQIVAVLARWGDRPQLLERIFARISEGPREAVAGNAFWQRLRWYPCLRLMYVAGIAALSANKYEMLPACWTMRVPSIRRDGRVGLIVRVMDELTEIVEQFRWLPDYDQKRVARSEYLFDSLRGMLRELLFVGDGYDDLFDQCEVLLALTYLMHDPDGSDWAPPGRFAWKNKVSVGPYRELLKEAEERGGSWGPISGGLFIGSNKTLLAVGKAYQARLDRLEWW